MRVNLKPVDTDCVVNLEVVGKTKLADGNIKNVRLASRPIPLSAGKWQDLSLTYAKDFLPAEDTAGFMPETIRAVVFESRQDGAGWLLIDNMHYYNSRTNNRPFELLWSKRHVFYAGKDVTIPLPVVAKGDYSGQLKMVLARSDEKVVKKLTQPVELHKGTTSLSVPLGKLPRGYYSLRFDLKAADSQYSSGMHFLVVPDRKTSPWLGTHFNGGTGAELEDLRLAGYGLVRWLGVPYTHLLDRDISIDWPIVRQAAEITAEKDLKILWTQMTPFYWASFNKEYLLDKIKKYEIKTDDDPFVHAFHYRSDHPEKFQAQMTFLADKLKGLVQYYEFGNEYDRIIFPGAEYSTKKRQFDWWSTPEEYARELVYFNNGVKAGDPDAKVTTVGVTCGLWTPGREEFVPRFLAEAKKITEKRPFDIFALHGYAGIENMRRVLNDLNKVYPGTPWVNTERGIKGNNMPILHVLLEEMLFARINKAEFYTSFINRRMPFTFTPELNINDNYHTGNFSTRLFDSSPSYKFAMDSAFAFLTDRGEQFKQEALPGAAAYSWKSAEGYVALLWKEKGAEATKVNISSDSEMTRYDLFGNENQAGKKSVDLQLSSMPVYVVSSSELTIKSLNAPSRKSITPLRLDKIQTASQVMLDSAAQIVKGRNFWQGASDPNIAPITVFGKDNLSGTATFLRDANNIHVVVKITDDSLTDKDQIQVSWKDKAGKEQILTANAKAGEGKTYSRVFTIPVNTVYSEQGKAQLSILVFDADKVVNNGQDVYLIGSFGKGTLEQPESITLNLE